MFGAEPYFTEKQFRDLLMEERILPEDLKAVIDDDLGERGDEMIGGLASRRNIRLTMLQHSVQAGSDAELRWQIAESDALRRFRDDVPYRIREQLLDRTREWMSNPSSLTAADVRDDIGRRYGWRLEHWREDRWETVLLHALWRICLSGVREVLQIRSEDTPSIPLRPRDILLQATGDDPDRYSNTLLIRFCAAFLDQGYADWNLPDREQGLFRSFISIYRHSKGPFDRWMRNLRAELRALWKSRITPEQSILDSLRLLGVAPEEFDRFITESLLALRGWAGMVWQMESSADWAARPAPPGSLLEFLAIRLILDHQAVLFFGEEYLGCNSSATEVIERAKKRIRPAAHADSERRAFEIFQLAQLSGWHPQQLLTLSRRQWASLVREVETFSHLERRRLFQEAYERRYRIQALDAFAIHSSRCRKRSHGCPDTAPVPEADAASAEAVREDDSTSTGSDTSFPAAAPDGSPPRPLFQIVCCIDEREESFRRHLEEVVPECETLGAAGFFGVAMNYRGIGEAHFRPLCPVNIRPDHYVREDVPYPLRELERRRSYARRRVGEATLLVHTRSRTFFGGILTGLAGSLAMVPMVARVLWPRLTARIRAVVGRVVQPPPMTQLEIERYLEPPGADNGHTGYTTEEMTDIVEGLLTGMGLSTVFSRIVVICGHGSSSWNNPHEAAHDCGACGGGRGGPNARAFARMANDWRVRARLASRGISIPDDTTFLAAYHNTCDDSMTWYDLELLPASHRNDFEKIRGFVDEARMLSAHERCRRFHSASLSLTPAEALEHVENRSEDLSQTRPEYGHATNALCVVGRRDWSRGLFLDRRAFLTSYDPKQDDARGTVLERLLQAVIPVCAGINLEYYFSLVDPVRYGCGTKLPHNISGLLGVMNGAFSDLQPGLPWQMVEIHEAVRLLFIIEAAPQTVLDIVDRSEAIARLVQGAWVQVAVIDPDTSEIHLFREGRFQRYEPTTDHLPTVDRSARWYAGHREHLGFATVSEALR